MAFFFFFLFRIVKIKASANEDEGERERFISLRRVCGGLWMYICAYSSSVVFIYLDFLSSTRRLLPLFIIFPSAFTDLSSQWSVDVTRSQLLMIIRYVSAVCVCVCVESGRQRLVQWCNQRRASFFSLSLSLPSSPLLSPHHIEHIAIEHTHTHCFLSPLSLVLVRVKVRIIQSSTTTTTSRARYTHTFVRSFFLF